MVARNSHIAQFQASYLFPEIGRRKQKLLAEQPNAHIISLGVGDTTQPLPLTAGQGMAQLATALTTDQGYRGYGPEQGDPQLRAKIANSWYAQNIQADEVFVNDGAKCDLARLQLLFGSDVQIALQDPAYPVYVDNAVLIGASGPYAPQKTGYSKIRYLPCLPENDFFPDLSHAEGADLLFFCSPNNPTGHVATHAQLQKLVAFAKSQRSVIIFDTAYAAFIQDPSLPKSIYEIEGAREVAIELGSFSKVAGFTGVRLGWTVVPKDLRYNEGVRVWDDWRRVISTTFNGASLLAQAGGLSIFAPEAQESVQNLIDYYLENARILRLVLQELGVPYFGGENAPYLWVSLGEKSSWEAFDTLLKEAHLVTTPGAGFGPSGEGFLRLSSLGLRGDVEEAAERLRVYLPQIYGKVDSGIH